MTTNLFEAAAKTNVKKIISVGSACAYPGNIVGDMKEEDFWSGPMHDSVIGYGSSKKIQLIAQQSYYKQYGLEGNHLALTNLYGEHDVFNEYRSHVVPALIKRFSDERENRSITNWGDGSAIREFIYVKDAAMAICKFIEQEHDLIPVNIGTGVGTSIKELAELTATYMNYHGGLEWDTTKPNGVRRKVLNISRMKEKIPDFKPIGFEVGLKITIDWYLDNKKEADARK
jgi:GDP-L-fucose synthase